MKKPKVLQRSKKVKIGELGKYRTLAGMQQFAAAWDESTLRHLLRRTLFGFKQEDINAFKGRSMAEVVQLLVSPSLAPLPPVSRGWRTSTCSRCSWLCRRRGQLSVQQAVRRWAVCLPAALHSACVGVHVAQGKRVRHYGVVAAHDQ